MTPAAPRRVCEGNCRRSFCVSLLVVAAFIVGSCQRSAQQGLPLPASPPVIDITLTDNSIHYSVPVPAGRAVFQVHNAGATDHQLKMVPLDEGFPPIQEQLAGSERRTVAPFAGVPKLAPGDRSVFAVDLVPGTRYAVLCLLSGADGIPYGVKGMNSEFVPTETGVGNDELGQDLS